jgi:hypothetical protein
MAGIHMTLKRKNTISPNYTVGAYSVYLVNSGGGSVNFSLLSTGATSGDTSGWYTPITAGIGTGKYAVVTSTGGALTMSGAALATRLQISTNPQWTGTYSGASIRSRTLTVQVWDAPSGGNLLDSGTLYLEVDGS